MWTIFCSAQGQKIVHGFTDQPYTDCMTGEWQTQKLSTAFDAHRLGCAFVVSALCSNRGLKKGSVLCPQEFCFGPLQSHAPGTSWPFGAEGAKWGACLALKVNFCIQVVVAIHFMPVYFPIVFVHCIDESVKSCVRKRRKLSSS